MRRYFFLSIPLLATAYSVSARAQGDWVIIEEGSPPAPAAAPQPAAPGQATLIVTVAPPPEAVGTVVVYLDGVAVGPAPWTGAVAPGAHKVHAEAPGWSSRKQKAKGIPGRSTAVELELRKGGELDVGRIYVGLVYSFGVGSSYSSGERFRLNYPGLGPGLNAGVRLPVDKLWLEAGLVIGPFADRWIDYSDKSWIALSPSDRRDQKDRVGKGMPFLLELRIVSPILKPFIYWTASFQPGVLIYKPYKYDAALLENTPENEVYAYGYGYGAALGDDARAIFVMNFRGGVAFFLVDWFEIRVDPLGMGMHCVKPFGIVWTPSFALDFRF